MFNYNFLYLFQANHLAALRQIAVAVNIFVATILEFELGILALKQDYILCYDNWTYPLFCA